ncbi:MAG: tetratricopeptide repeat protein [Cyanobacteria bacterium J06621_12]
MVKQRLTNWLQDLDADAVDEYNSLRRSLQRNSGFGIFFTQCSPAIRSNIIAEIKKDISNKKIEVLHFDQAIDSLYNKIIDLPNLRDIDILFISGLEHSLIEYENYTFNSQEDIEKNTVKRLTQDKQSVPRLLGYMNLQRDRFRDDLDISLVFIVPFFGIDYFIKRAPDFFDWRSGFFRFVPQKDYLTSIDIDSIFTIDSNQSRHELLDLRSLSKELELESTEQVQILQKEFILLIKCNRYEEAIASCDKCLAINPNEDRAWFNRGFALGELERYEEAIASYDKCLAINPNKDIAWFNRGVDLSRLERYEEVIASYDKCLAINPNEDTAWFNRGVDLSRLERYEEAIASYDKCLAINPNQDTAWLNRGVVLGELERYEEAIASYDKCLAINPDKAIAWFNRGSALSKLKMFQQSFASFRKAYELNPKLSSDLRNIQLDLIKSKLKKILRPFKVLFQKSTALFK